MSLTTFEGIPIFFVHKTNSSYLKYALRQARKFNPDSSIYLLGDESNNYYPFLTHVNILDYSESAEEFKKVYRHMSATNIGYELFCFLRWFYIRDFVVKHNIESFIYLDSDVLVFSNLTEAIKPYSHFLLANTGDAMPAVTYFGNKSVINDFCDFTIKQYTDKHYSERLNAEWEAQRKRNWGGVCDMVVFLYYFRDYPENNGKLDAIMDDAVFDRHIRMSEGFEMENVQKKFYWKSCIPYGMHLKTKRLIRFHTIHYHSHSKSLMYRHYCGGGYYKQRVSEFFLEMRNKYQLRTKLTSFFKSLSGK